MNTYTQNSQHEQAHRMSVGDGLIECLRQLRPAVQFERGPAFFLYVGAIGAAIASLVLPMTHRAGGWTALLVSLFLWLAILAGDALVMAFGTEDWREDEIPEMPAEIPKKPSLPPQVQECSRVPHWRRCRGTCRIPTTWNCPAGSAGRCPWERRTMTTPKARPLFDRSHRKQAVLDSFAKLDPRYMIRNPVMFVVVVGAALTLLLVRRRRCWAGRGPAGFILAISLWLWFTVLFANFAEAMAEGRGKAQADTLRKARRDVQARKLAGAPARMRTGRWCRPRTLRKGDVVLVEAGRLHPRRRRGHRGRRLRGRKRHHRRESPR